MFHYKMILVSVCPSVCVQNNGYFVLQAPSTIYLSCIEFMQETVFNHLTPVVQELSPLTQENCLTKCIC